MQRRNGVRCFCRPYCAVQEWPPQTRKTLQVRDDGLQHLIDQGIESLGHLGFSQELFNVSQVPLEIGGELDALKLRHSTPNTAQAARRFLTVARAERAS